MLAGDVDCFLGFVGAGSCYSWQVFEICWAFWWILSWKRLLGLRRSLNVGGTVHYMCGVLDHMFMVKSIQRLCPKMRDFLSYIGCDVKYPRLL